MKPLYTINQSVVKLGIRSPVCWSQHLLQGDHVPHDHDFTEVGIVLSGVSTHATERGEYTLRPGDVFVIPQGVTHTFFRSKKCSILNIYYLAEWFIKDFNFESEHLGLFNLFFSESLRNSRRPPTESIFTVEEPDEIDLILSELHSITQKKGGASLSWKSCCFKKILLLLSDSFLKTNQFSTQNLPPIIWNYYREIDRLLHAREKLDLQKVSKKLFISRDHLGALFRKHLGFTPNDFFLRRRIQFVCQELLKNNGANAQVAYEFGFTDEAHLCHQFKKIMKLTPTEYRQKYHP